MKGGGIGSWLSLAFVCLALAPLMAGSWYFLQRYEQALQKTMAANLLEISNKKYDQIDRFFQERYADMNLLSSRSSVQNAIADFVKLWHQQSPQSPIYQQSLASTDENMMTFLEAGDYYDLLLIDPDGNVLYSVTREAELGTNLFTGPYRESELAKGVEIALTLLQTNQTLFAPYAPSKGRKASFLVAPVLHEGIPIGAVALQFNWDKLESIVTDRTGLGLTGETVLAQRDGEYVLFTSPLRHIQNATFQHRAPFDTAAAPIKQALAGQSGYSANTYDYAGHSVIAAWRYLPALQWGMVVKIDCEEAFALLNHIKHVALVGLLVLTTLTSLLALLFVRSLTVPLRSLISASRQMAQRNFQVKAKMAGPRELRELATSFNQMNADLAELYEGLKIKIHERDVEIEARKNVEAALIEARDSAQAANRAKSIFLANMSHELRTPLNAILGFAQIMQRDTSLAETHRSQLETINRSGNHLLSLINDVLEISRIEAGRTKIENEVFSLNELLKAVEDMIRVRAESKGLQFNSLRDGALPSYVYGDAHHLRQILLNLLSNAVKYTEQGSVSLRLRAYGDKIEFEVADTGIGIPHEDLQNIFQAFYQTDLGAKKGEGTGLGLTISHEFVRMMGGEINVRSVPGDGSVFTVNLPLPEAEAPAVSIPPSRVIGLAADQAPVRILVAEDNPDNRELIRLLLSAVGFEVKTVENGQQAIECFQTWQPHFIWMDMRMPVLNGYEATKNIRSLPGGNKVKIAALTASAFREDRDAILAAGCDDLLAKPIDERRLFQVMGDLLGVRYQFAEDDEVKTEPVRTNGTIDLSPLDSKLKAELKTAAELLDAEAVDAIVVRIMQNHPEIANAIRVWTSVYRFDVIAKLCQNGEHPAQ